MGMRKRINAIKKIKREIAKVKRDKKRIKRAAKPATAGQKLHEIMSGRS